MIKKVTLLISLLSIVTIIFAACSETTDTPQTTTLDVSDTDTATEVTPLDALETIDFDGYQFRFYTRNCCEAHYGGVYQESETGDVVNDAVYQRNRTIEEKFNIVIAEPVLDVDASPVILINAILANDHIADVAIPHFRYLGTIALENMLIDMGELPYLDFEQPWWATNLIEQYSIFEKHYVAYGDIGIDNITHNAAIYFNKRLSNEYVQENLYDTVRSGKWTLDKMGEVIRSVGADLNGDGTININDDMFGFQSYTGYFFMFQVGANQPTTVRDEDNIPQLSINTPKMVTIVEKVHNMTQVYEYTYVEESTSANQFVDGRVLLYIDLLNTATQNAFRDMEDDFGLLPFPKYDEMQENYYSHASAHSSLLGIPVTNPDPDRTALILEALVIEGYNTIRPALYDIAFKVKNTRDDDSAEMLDIILEGRTGDFADIYDEWGLVYTLDHIVARRNSADFASFYAANEAATLNRLSNAIDVFMGE